MSAAPAIPRPPGPEAVPPTPDADRGHGRARLWLGIVGVGTWVVFSAVLLAVDAVAAVRATLPGGGLGDAAVVGTLVAAYVLIQLPLDWLGGFAVPRRYGRRVPPPGSCASTLLRGIAVHALVFSAGAAVLYAGGAWGGAVGAFAAGLAWVGVLAAGRGTLARLVANLPTSDTLGAAAEGGVPTRLRRSADEGFTGGVGGFVAPRVNVLPAAWAERLGPEWFALARRRRDAVVRSGAWRAGRLAALAFTAAGLAGAVWLAGPGAAGTAVGVVETGLWFTLWSFGGLLVLPTLSRAAVYRVDRQLIDTGADARALAGLTAALDGLQDGEPSRGRWIERVFHPIPSVANRTRGDGPATAGCWDVARTAVYLGLGGMSLLTRSVHCNVGRPALWVWLPTD